MENLGKGRLLSPMPRVQYSVALYGPLQHAFPQILRLLTQGHVVGWRGTLVAGSRGMVKPAAPEPSTSPSWYFHAACFSLSGEFCFFATQEGVFPQLCVSPALLFSELLVSVYSPVQELKDELKSNTFG